MTMIFFCAIFYLFLGFCQNCTIITDFTCLMKLMLSAFWLSRFSHLIRNVEYMFSFRMSTNEKVGADSSTLLTNDEIGRYSRQMILPELGMKGQQQLKNGSVLIVGVGGLGSPASLFLAAAGIGERKTDLYNRKLFVL
jgi:hypothetical protein